MALLRRVVKYLLQTKDLGLRYEADIEVEIEGWADAAFKDDPTKRSTGGMSINLIGSASIAAKAKLQSTITLSSCEAEMIQLCILGQHTMHTRNLLGEMGWPQRNATILHEDNEATENLAKHGRLSEKTIHMTHKDLWIVEHVQKGDLRIKHVDSADQVADIFTKALPVEQFKKLRALLLNTNGAMAMHAKIKETTTGSTVGGVGGV
jgi:hypothetical protein